MAYVRDQRLAGWTADARKAIRENPDYFVWWYTVKSVGLGIVGAVATYYIGKDIARKQRNRRQK